MATMTKAFSAIKARVDTMQSLRVNIRYFSLDILSMKK